MSLLDDDLNIDCKNIILNTIKRYLKSDLEFHKMYYGICNFKLSQLSAQYTDKKWKHILENPHKYYLYTWPNLTGYEIHIDLVSKRFRNDDWGFQIWMKDGEFVNLKTILES